MLLVVVVVVFVIVALQAFGRSLYFQTNCTTTNTTARRILLRQYGASDGCDSTRIRIQSSQSCALWRPPSLAPPRSTRQIHLHIRMSEVGRVRMSEVGRVRTSEACSIRMAEVGRFRMTEVGVVRISEVGVSACPR